MLDLAEALAHVRGRELMPAGPASAVELSGGVSSVVIAVRSEDGSGVLVKRSLPRLRVATKWVAKRERTLTEAAALRVMGAITPGRVPAVVDVDLGTLTLVTELAPEPVANWRELLSTGELDPEVARELGSTLARWHQATRMPWQGSDGFLDSEVFEQLRLRPFHERVVEVHPQLARSVGPYSVELRSARHCLVHGDFSPKNVLVGSELLWIVDHEVAHIGHPVFDLAFMGTHIALMAVARPDRQRAFRHLWLTFYAAYVAGVDALTETRSLGGHIGCLLLARVDGRSPEPGLDQAQREVVRRIGYRLLERAPQDPRQVWIEVAESLG